MQNANTLRADIFILKISLCLTDTAISIIDTVVEAINYWLVGLTLARAGGRGDATHQEFI